MLLIELIIKFKAKKARHCLAFFMIYVDNYYSTVTDFAKFLGWSTLHPLITAI